MGPGASWDSSTLFISGDGVTNASGIDVIELHKKLVQPVCWNPTETDPAALPIIVSSAVPFVATAISSEAVVLTYQLQSSPKTSSRDFPHTDILTGKLMHRSTTEYEVTVTVHTWTPSGAVAAGVPFSWTAIVAGAMKHPQPS
jgi:hypothetical protein